MAGSDKRRFAPFDVVVVPFPYAEIAYVDPSRIERRTGRLDKATARTVSQRLRAFLQE
jgi:hypothetical protein